MMKVGSPGRAANFANLWQDARYALRLLAKTPGFTLTAVLSLALGIGANTAIFSVVNVVLLRPLPFPHPSELVDISVRSTSFDIRYLGLSLPDLTDIRSSASAFSSLATYDESSKEFSGEGKPERIESIEVSEDLFSILGMRPPRARSALRAISSWFNRVLPVQCRAEILPPRDAIRL